MIDVCDCDFGLSNTGDPKCPSLAKVTTGMFLVQQFADDGTENVLSLSAPVTDAVIDAKINEADKSKRWYPLQDFENLVDERGDDVTETPASGNEYFIQEGSRALNGELFNKDAALHKELQSFRCKKLAVFNIEKGGSLVGKQSNADYIAEVFKPIKIQNGTLKSSFIKATDTSAQKVALKFSYDDGENDGDIKMLKPSDTTGPVDFTSKDGLLDVNSNNVSVGQTAWVVQLFEDYGTAATRNPVEGLEAGDFAIENLTDAASVTVLTAPETPGTPGEYTITYASQDLTDVLELTPTEAGFDFSRVVRNTGTVA